MDEMNESKMEIIARFFKNQWSQLISTKKVKS